MVQLYYFNMRSNLWISTQYIDTEVGQPARAGKLVENCQNFRKSLMDVKTCLRVHG